MSDRNEIAIAYIHNGVGEIDWMKSLFNFIMYDSNHRRIACNGKVQDLRGTYLDDNREGLAREFHYSRREKYLLFLDTDHTFPPEYIYALYDNAEINDIPIVSALYYGELQKGQVLPVWFDWRDREKGWLTTAGNIDANQGLREIVACGMGCCLIRRDVFEAMARVPEWFNSPWNFFGRDPYYYDPEKRWYAYGEDTCFCVRAAKLGFQAVGDPRLVLGHLKKWCIDNEMVQMLMRQHPEWGTFEQTRFEAKI